MRVIGTAGHVDHGKSTLIAALTGTHPDRLKEEQAREMTIELGFGWLTLPGGEEIGIVDVPGHRDFIGNMLAGVGGIDAVVLVIAADEGVMPQTREHLAILDLLQIPAGMIALTKTDLAPDPDWLNLVEQDIRTTLQKTVLENAPLLRLSAKTGQGLDEFLTALETLLKGKPEKLDLNRPRLPIDRVFSIAGFGTVVTGTLADGSLQLGDELVILPSGKTGRVRGLQTHKKKEEIAKPGSRTAVNISGVAVDDIQRGETLAKPGDYQATRRLDARFRLLDDIAHPLKHNTEVKLFVGASETIATLRLLGAENLNPGEEAWIQLETRHPVIAVRDDRYILRRPSPAETLGGGVIVDDQPAGRHKRFDNRVLEKLNALAEGSPADVLYQAALANGADLLDNLLREARLDASDAKEAIDALFAAEKLLVLEDDFVIAAAQWYALSDQSVKLIEAYHQKYHLRAGIPREELKSRLKIETQLFNAMLKKMIEEKSIVQTGKKIAMPRHGIRFSRSEQAQVDALMRRFAQNPFAPPTVKESRQEAGEEIFNALLELGELLLVSGEVVFRTSDIQKMIAMLQEHLAAQGQITVAETRDLFGTSRRYVLALLEYLDAEGITRREGDYRVLAS